MFCKTYEILKKKWTTLEIFKENFLTSLVLSRIPGKDLKKSILNLSVTNIFGEIKSERNSVSWIKSN